MAASSSNNNKEEDGVIGESWDVWLSKYATSVPSTSAAAAADNDDGIQHTYILFVYMFWCI